MAIKIKIMGGSRQQLVNVIFLICLGVNLGTQGSASEYKENLKQAKNRHANPVTASMITTHTQRPTAVPQALDTQLPACSVL